MLSEKIERFVKNFNELKCLSIKYLMDEDMLKSMSPEDLKFIYLKKENYYEKLYD